MTFGVVPIVGDGQRVSGAPLGPAGGGLAARRARDNSASRWLYQP